jgi:guanine deaminase
MTAQLLKNRRVKMSVKKTLILKGNIIYAESDRELKTLENGYIVSEAGVITGVFPQLPQRYAGVKVRDYGDSLIIPGLIDLHLHAPQFAIRGMGMDLELIPWLNQYAFAEEAKYADVEYAAVAYGAFCAALKSGVTTRACIFASLHVPATDILMNMLEESGLVTYVGKVNMDRNCPEYLVERACDSLLNTEDWIRRSVDAYKNTRPIITPRFVPSCSEELMTALGGLAERYRLPVQSHLSENLNEIKWVKELHPNCETYSDVYDRCGLFGHQPTVMAHCVYLTDSEMDMIRNRGVLVAHCPQSNINISSGIAPMRRMLHKDIRIGLGTDVAGGFSISMFRAVSDAIQASKMYAVLVDRSQEPLTLAEAFYMATKGGGSFWGSVGSFEPGYELDAVVIDDSDIKGTSPLTLAQRLERAVHLSDDRHIKAKYVRGEQVL